MYGISVTTIFFLPFVPFSISAFARSFIFPSPVSYISNKSSVFVIAAPVGKSGPFMYFISPFVEISGLSIYAITPSITSPGLCGGILVAIPTAIPVVPFMRRFGRVAGRTRGSFSLSSKFGPNGTRPLSRFSSIVIAVFDSLASVYRIAAAPSPSIEPKFPCPSTSGSESEYSSVICTSAS